MSSCIGPHESTCSGDSAIPAAANGATIQPPTESKQLHATMLPSVYYRACHENLVLESFDLADQNF